MSFCKTHIKELIEESLQEMEEISKVNFNTPEAVNLLLGTIAQESKFGTYLKQLGNGPALSIFQIEEFTFNDLINRFGKKFPFIKCIGFKELKYNLKYAIWIARIKYYSCPGKLPDTLKGMATYWKKYYNTYLGAGTEKEFIDNYNKFIMTG